MRETAMKRGYSLDRLVERNDRLVPREDRDVSEAIRSAGESAAHSVRTRFAGRIDIPRRAATPFGRRASPETEQPRRRDEDMVTRPRT
jgi:hypothetical protein